MSNKPKFNGKIKDSDLNEDDDRQEVKIASMMALQIGVRTLKISIISGEI